MADPLDVIAKLLYDGDHPVERVFVDAEHFLAALDAAGLRVVPDDRPARCPNCWSPGPRANALDQPDGLCADPWHTETAPEWGPLTLERDAGAVPETDHSMCAPPRPDHHRTTIAVDISESTPQARRWVYPAGHVIGISMSDDQITAAGGAIPEPEPTVVERAAKVLAAFDDGMYHRRVTEAQALADAGLLIEDGA